MRTVRDEFTAVAYGNNNGTQRWSRDWTETGDDGLPYDSGGASIVTDQSSGRLRIGRSGITILARRSPGDRLGAADAGRPDTADLRQGLELTSSDPGTAPSPWRRLSGRCASGSTWEGPR
jgi:hypothetical protein